MSRNGSGGYNLPAGNPVVTGTPISSTVMNNTLADIATALAQSISQDGQTPITANLPMTGFRHTNVANAQNRNEYATAAQVQDGSLNLLSVSGTDTITATTTPAFTALAAGMFFGFVAAGDNTTTSVTININGLGAKSVVRSGGGAIAAGDIKASQVVELHYNGTSFEFVNTQHAKTADSAISAANASAVPWSGVSSKPTTISGYGITDALTTASSATTQAGTNTTSAVTPKALADTMIGGVGQSWQSFTVGTNRIFGTPYTNNTGRPICVSFSNGNSSVGTTVVVDSLTIFSLPGGGGYGSGTGAFFVVPNNSTYTINSSGTTGISWAELR